MLHSCFSPREVAFSVRVTHTHILLCPISQMSCHTPVFRLSWDTRGYFSTHQEGGCLTFSSWPMGLSQSWASLAQAHATSRPNGGLSCSYPPPLLDPRTKRKVCSPTLSRGLHLVIRSSLIWSPPLEFQVLVFSFSLMERRARFRQKMKMSFVLLADIYEPISSRCFSTALNRPLLSKVSSKTHPEKRKAVVSSLQIPPLNW